MVIDLPATGRMTAVLFPVSLSLAEQFRGWRFAVLASGFAVGQIFLAARYFLWLPPY